MLFCASASSQNVKYYQLIRTEKNGVSNKNVEGGLFITFVGNMCFESDKNGVGINHGTMQRNDGYSNSQITVFDGSSYWGKQTTFKFNADRSGLNVIFDDGEIFIYRQTSPPASVTTCSPIRNKKTSSSSITTGYTPQPVYPPMQQYPQQQYQQPQTPETARPQTQQPSREKCTWCNGTGEVVKDDAFELGMGGTKYCNKCGKTVSTSHYHAPCPYCHGKGYR